MRKTIITSTLALISISAFADTSIPDVKGQMKVTANVAAGCDLSAENINFGVLQMPLNDISAQSNILLKCSKGAIVNLKVSGVSSASDKYGFQTLRVAENNNFNNNIKIFKNGTPISDLEYDLFCDSAYSGRVGFKSEAAAILYGYTEVNFIGTTFFTKEPNLEICGGSKYEFRAASLNFKVKETLVGVSSNEKINFFVTKPESNDEWSSNYEVIAEGVEQLIPLKANIKSADNPTHRMTPDTYLSTLTVQLTY